MKINTRTNPNICLRDVKVERERKYQSEPPKENAQNLERENAERGKQKMQRKHPRLIVVDQT